MDIDKLIQLRYGLGQLADHLLLFECLQETYTEGAYTYLSNGERRYLAKLVAVYKEVERLSTLAEEFGQTLFDKEEDDRL